MVRLQQGVTLIELMITIALLAILAVAGIPLGRAWIANVQITKTEKLFLDAYVRAKNEAIRNPNGISQDSATAVATLSVDNSNKTIKVLDSKSPPTLMWTVDIPPNVTVRLSSATTSTECADSQVTLDNNGHILTANCTKYTISANGGTDATGSL
ncbi:pilus assembly FimT family protein [Acinetobacter sp. CAAS 2-6]|uniref:pilus assembly FimT family protein n=1 Tax=Acinetobacter sp. CAAS 2-6 TaxID=3016358 RepID=UPI002DD61C99|nr:prepilin-type N-terminal cleavage/methylation domain-containing protein [Acinetobacter sp. CAAS 2-6]